MQVVAAIIKKEGKFLITKRLSSQSSANKWEFPGGKVEPNETHKSALEREILEEIGLKIRVKDLAGVVKTTKLFLYAYYCDIVGGQIKHIEVKDSIWTANPIDYDLLETDKILLSKIA